jgi:hypothetical protein
VTALTVTIVPADAPTTPSGLPVIDARHVGIEQAVETVTEALCAVAQGFLSTAIGDDSEYELASDLVRRAHAITGDMRHLALMRRAKSTTIRRDQGGN